MHKRPVFKKKYKNWSQLFIFELVFPMKVMLLWYSLRLGPRLSKEKKNKNPLSKDATLGWYLHT